MKIVRDVPEAVTVAIVHGYLTLNAITVPRADVWHAIGPLRLCRGRDGRWRLYVPDPRGPLFELDALTDAERARLARR